RARRRRAVLHRRPRGLRADPGHRRPRQGRLHRARYPRVHLVGFARRARRECQRAALRRRRPGPAAQPARGAARVSPFEVRQRRRCRLRRRDDRPGRGGARGAVLAAAGGARSIAKPGRSGHGGPMHGPVAGEGTEPPPAPRARVQGLRRLLPVALVALGLAPGTWWRSPLPPRDRHQPLVVTPEPAGRWIDGGLRLLGAWRLESHNRHFHGYSALAVLGDGTLLAVSDRGRKLLLPPGFGEGAPARMSFFSG